MYGMWIASTVISNLIFSMSYDKHNFYTIPVIIVTGISCISVVFSIGIKS